MLALSPSLLAPIEWAFEESTSHNDGSLFSRDNGATPHQFSCSPPADHEVDFDISPPISLAGSGDLTVVKKLNHNASERDRRKKINSLYSSLRSMLPLADQSVLFFLPLVEQFSFGSNQVTC